MFKPTLKPEDPMMYTFGTYSRLWELWPWILTTTYPSITMCDEIIELKC